MTDFDHLMQCRDKHCLYCNDFEEAPIYDKLPPPAPSEDGDEGDDEDTAGLNEIPADYMTMGTKQSLILRTNSKLSMYSIEKFFETLVWWLTGHGTEARRQVREAVAYRPQPKPELWPTMIAKRKAGENVRAGYHPEEHD